jgi:hypothetical protein
VVKHILSRESLLMNLRHLSESMLSGGAGGGGDRNKTVDKHCTSVLQLLSEIREVTIRYLEALCLWRQKSYFKVGPPPPPYYILTNFPLYNLV